MDTTLVTGVAGFIGSHLARRLLDAGHAVVGVDLDDGRGTDPMAALRRRRLAPLVGRDGFHLRRLDLSHPEAVDALGDELATVPVPPRIVHLAARAGVRASVDEPVAFVRANVLAFTCVAELAHRVGAPHLVYASSSSVYGGLEKVPFSPSDPVGHPISVYGATKRADELLAHAYAHLHGLPTTGLRLFTVYGPRGRPDMAYWRFAEAILAGRPVQIYGDGAAVRDVTYVDDVVDAIVALLDRPPRGEPTWAAAAPDPGTSTAPFVLHNVGHGGQVSVLELVQTIAEALEVRALVEHVEPRAGDVPRTWSDGASLLRAVGSSPTTPLTTGVERFVSWFRPWFEEHGPM